MLFKKKRINFTYADFRCHAKTSRAAYAGAMICLLSNKGIDSTVAKCKPVASRNNLIPAYAYCPDPVELRSSAILYHINNL
jgi:hypothetical protein